MEDKIDRDKALQDAYNILRIGQPVQIRWPVMFARGTIMDKYLEIGVNNRKELYIDVVLGNDDIVEHYLCYSGFYPRYDLL